MIGTIAGCQWWIYDTFKTSIGLQTTGGDCKKDKIDILLLANRILNLINKE
jgi:hypothetical protein